MNKAKTKRIAHRYQAALQSHLAGTTTSTPLEEARALGLLASAAGMDALDLILIHEEAMTSEADAAVQPQEGRRANLTNPGSFLVVAVTALHESNVEIVRLANAAQREAELRLKEEITRGNLALENTRRLEGQARHLARQLLLAQEEERREISRELHDEVAQILAGINVRLAAMREGGKINFQNFEFNMQQTQKMIEESADVVHRFAKKLRPAILDDLGLIPALRSLIKDLQLPPELDIRLETTTEAEGLNKIRYTVLYRVASEALINVIRHAHAQRVTVRLLPIPDGIRLEVEDDGQSFAVDQVFLSQDCKRLGLLGMKERVEMVGGSFSICSEPGEGTLVSANVPFVSGSDTFDAHEK